MTTEDLSRLDIHKHDAGLCMVRDCTQRAWYRSRQSKRGYCKQHKALVTLGSESRPHWSIEECLKRDRPWAIEVADV